MMLVLPVLTMEQSNVRKKNGTIECDKNRVIYDVETV